MGAQARETPGHNPARSNTTGAEVAVRKSALTTKADHNGTRRGPIPAEASVAQLQVSDCPDSLSLF